MGIRNFEYKGNRPDAVNYNGEPVYLIKYKNVNIFSDLKCFLTDNTDLDFNLYYGPSDSMSISAAPGDAVSVSVSPMNPAQGGEHQYTVTISGAASGNGTYTLNTDGTYFYGTYNVVFGESNIEFEIN